MSEPMKEEVRRYGGPADVGEVYIDGSAYEVGSSKYAGWGMRARDKPVFCDSGPVEGGKQTAARAEVRALYEVFNRAARP